LNLLDWQFARVCQPIYLLAEVPLVGILLRELLPAAEEEMVPVASGLLERREKILLELETLGEEEVLLYSGALLVIWCSRSLSSSPGWTGEHRHLYFWSLPMHRFFTKDEEFVSTGVLDGRMKSVKKFEDLP